MEWKEVNISDISIINASQYSTKENWDHFLYLDTGNITEGKINELQHINSTEKLPSRARRKVSDGDIVYSCVRPNQKHYGLMHNPSDNMLVSTGFAVITPNKEQVDSAYLYYYLTQQYLTDFFQTIGEQAVSTYPTIKASDLGELKIMLPSLKVQHCIASILSSLDSKIETNNKINAKLEEMAQALFKSWFVDFEPFKDGKFVESELGMIPEGWRVGSIYEYVNVVYGAPYKSKLFNDEGNGLPLIRIRDLKDCAPQFFTEELLPNTEYVERGDVVAGMDAEFSPYIWKGEKGLLNQRVCKLKPAKEGVSSLYVLYFMKPHLEFVQSYKTGTTVSHLGKGDIDHFVSVLPPFDIVVNLSEKLDAILLQICNLSQENTRLSQLRDTLLPKLMNGEIEI